MTVCKYFLQGRCSFGANCRFEHRQPHPGEGTPFGTSGFGSSGFGSTSGFGANNTNNNNFGAFGRLGSTQQQQQNASQTSGAKGPAYNAQTIELDMSTDRPIWRLSCYAPGKEEPNVISGIVELSPEESRLNYYASAKLAGNDIQYQSELNQLTTQMEQQVQQIRANPQAAIEHVQRQKSQSQLGAFAAFGAPTSFSSQPFQTQSSTGAFGSTTNINNIFGQTAKPNVGFGSFGQTLQQPQSTSNSVFNSKPLFGQTSSISPGSSSFGSTSTPFPATGQTKPSTFLGGFGSSSVFGQPQSLGSGAPPTFGQPSTFLPTTTPAFGQTSLLGGFVGQPSNTRNTGGAFAPSESLVTQTQPPLGSFANQGSSQAPSQTFLPTPVQQITAGGSHQAIDKQEMDAFMAPQFELRKVPESEPPMDLR